MVQIEDKNPVTNYPTSQEEREKMRLGLTLALISLHHIHINIADPFNGAWPISD